MDLKQIKHEETSWLTITYPDGMDSDFRIELRGMDAPEVKKVYKKWDRIATKAGKKGLSFDQKEQAGVELLMVAIVSWEGLEEEGKAVECNDEEKKILLTSKNALFVKAQIDEHVGDTTNFFSRIEKTS